jgi:diguanylate cyclase (GGDEF)-like protein/PAS domain S-box-containing protein
MSEDLFRKVADSISEGIYQLDAHRRIVFWNRSAERITGYTKAEALGMRCMDNLLRHVDGKGCELCEGGCPVSAAMKERRTREAEVFLHHKDGHRVQVSVKVIPLAGEDGAIDGAIEVFADRSDRAELLAELETLRKENLVDPLTGLGNRRFADISLDSALRSLDEEGAGFGVLMLDIDHFKRVNDDYGHPVGDRVLRMIGWTMANAIRRRDSAARWGGEEFLVIAPGADATVLSDMAERARTLVRRSWITVDGGRRVAATVSIGGAVARKGETKDALIARADERLYSCKRAGRDRVEVGD